MGKWDRNYASLNVFYSQRVKRVEKSHSTFITGLEFIPGGEETEVIRGFSDASVVSISVDHHVCIHHVPRLRKGLFLKKNWKCSRDHFSRIFLGKISMMTAFLLVGALLFVTFVVCSYLGL